MNINISLADLSVVASVQSHPVLPEVFEEGGKNLCLDVVRFHTISAATLLHHLKDKMNGSKRFFVLHQHLHQLVNVTNGCRVRTERKWLSFLLILMLVLM